MVLKFFFIYNFFFFYINIDRKLYDLLFLLLKFLMVVKLRVFFRNHLWQCKKFRSRLNNLILIVCIMSCMKFWSNHRLWRKFFLRVLIYQNLFLLLFNYILLRFIIIFNFRSASQNILRDYVISICSYRVRGYWAETF